MAQRDTPSGLKTTKATLVLLVNKQGTQQYVSMLSLRGQRVGSCLLEEEKHRNKKSCCHTQNAFQTPFDAYIMYWIVTVTL